MFQFNRNKYLRDNLYIPDSFKNEIKKCSNVDFNDKKDLNYYLSIKNELEKCIYKNNMIMDEFNNVNSEVKIIKYILFNNYYVNRKKINLLASINDYDGNIDELNMTFYPSDRNIENLKKLLPLLKKEENELIERTQKKIEDFLRSYPHFYYDNKTSEVYDIYQKMRVYYISLMINRNIKNNMKKIEIH